MSRREAKASTVTASTSQTLDRGLQVLEAVARAGDPLTVAEAAASVGLDRTVAHRLIATLAVRGYLQRDSSGGYRLGPTCLALASAITDLRTMARPYLEGLRDATGETAHVVVLSGREVVFLDAVESAHALRAGARTGRLLPAHATSVGKALLAALPPEHFRALYEHAELFAITAKTITDRDEFERQLAAIRERGYATNQGESENGVGSIGMVVRNPAGEPRAALSIALPLERWSEAAEEHAASVLKSAAAALGAYL
jgi:DNA-binding IclR family transcriptional regulator